MIFKYSFGYIKPNRFGW